MAHTIEPGWRDFNGQFLAYIIVCGVLAVFFLLYFNRVFASIISYIIRTYTWHTYRVYIDIQALQWSLLGGRVFFTGLRYHGNNETILVQNGHITWSYWLRRVRDVGIGAGKKNAKHGDGIALDASKQPELPCRVNIVVSGLEWFVYNRSAAYDSMLNAMTENPPPEPADTLDGTEDLQNGSAKLRHRQRKSQEQADHHKENGLSFTDEKKGLETHHQRTFSSNSVSGSNHETGEKEELPLMLQMFPIHFRCDKAAMVMGNENTKSILIAKAKSLSGEIDAADCQTPDPYRQLFKIQLEEPVIEMRENDGFKEEQLAKAHKDQQTAKDSHPVQNRRFFRAQRRKVLGQLRYMIPYWMKSVESFSVTSRDGGEEPVDAHIPGSNQWQGLSRYLNDDDEDDKLRWSSVEYACVNTVAESPEATLTIMWDVPGRITSQSALHSPKGNSSSDNVNGTTAPAWAISLSLKGGTLHYGPWADRQRAELQRVFFPGLCKDSVPAQKLPLGAYRVPTQFDFYLELEEEVILRVPTREDSKNWRWKKEALTLQQHRKQGSVRERGRDRKSAATTAAEQRPYGWLDIKVAPNATVSYTMDMLARPTGYTNTLKIDLPATEISTSVNHGILWKSGRQQISCDMSTPLKWNALRTWRFNIDSDGLELFILRDHIFLLTDLIDDWGSGPPSEYLTFTPFKYLLNLKLRSVKLYLNVNDVNIVNDPINFEENTYLVISSPCLIADTCIPIDNYRPPLNAIPFKVTAEPLRVDLHVPPWNTQATFLPSKEIGHLESLTLEGKYHYNSTTSPANTDTLVLDVGIQSPTAFLYGFLFRYFLQLKDNYFGDHVHFRTLDEHQEALRTKEAAPDSQSTDRPPHKKSNDMDVILSIRTDDPKIFLPANMYSPKRHIPIEAASLAIDLRFTNYYMDLDLCFSPLSLSLGDDDGGATSPMSAISSTQLFIDGISIYGHRLFGLPPVEPTYLCNWDLKIGAVTGDCSTDFIASLIRGGKAFGFSLDDDENALIPYSSIIMYDVTFLRAFIESVHVWMHVDEAAFLFSTGTVDVQFNDWARTHYSRRADLKVPNLEIACVNSESATRRRSRLRSQVDTDVFLRTNIHFALIGRKYDFAQERQLQQELIRRHDQRTHRTNFLLLPGLLGDFTPDAVDNPAQSVPSVPQPVLSGTIADNRSMLSLGSSHHSAKLRRKSSFLSLASSNNGSILRPGSIRTAQQSRVSGRTTSSPTLLKGGESKQTAQPRGHPTSSAQFSAPLSAYGEHGDRRDPHHTSISFSSQYFAPSFPLQNVRPDTQEAILHSIEENEDDNLFGSSDFSLENFHPDQLSQDHAHQSLLLELPSGISIFLNTPSLRCIASLIRSLSPSDPEDILDTLHIGAVTDIFDSQKDTRVNGTITDFILRLPQANLRFLNCSTFDSDDSSQEPQDQYDLSLKTLVLATRSGLPAKDVGGTPISGSSQLSFHFRVASMELSAAERLTNLDQMPQAAVLTRIERIMVSMGSKEVNYIDADVGGVHASSASGKVEYLASLIHRTNILASETATLFSDTFSAGDERMKQFTYRVITEGQQASDAPFVVRPSAILRTATQHLRTYDSWKLVTRLRQIWSTLDFDAKESLKRDCLFGFSQCPNDARHQVIAAFERWRSWDLEDPRHAVLLDNVFGKAPEPNASASSQIPTMVIARIQEMQFVLDPGPKQNEIVVLELTFRVQERNNNIEMLDEKPVDSGEPLTLVNVYCGEAWIKTNWELCELADDILRLYKQADSSTSEEPKPKKEDIAEHKPSRPLHVVCVLGEGVVSFEAINLSSRLQSSDLKLSILTASGARGSTSTNVILGCESATAKIKSHSQVLATARLQHPSVIIVHDVQSDKQLDTHTIKAAASSQDLKFVVRQDPIVLAEVLDLLVKDEVAQLYALGQIVPSNPSPEPRERKGGRLSTIQGNLAMFLDSYTITLPLLRSLTYTISGVVARANMAANYGKEMILDFDIKENSHDMQIEVNNTPRSISLLQIPPTNGRITSHTSAEEHSVTALFSLELIELDASAVYSLLTALNRPQISNAINDLQEQVKIIQEHIDEIFGSTETSSIEPTPELASPKSDDPKLTYTVHGSLAGLKIFGIAPIKSDTELRAGLSFHLDTVQIQVANKLDEGVILENPEIHINLHQIMFNIEKGSDAMGMKSCGNLAFGALITATNRESEEGKEVRSFDFKSEAFEINLSSDTVSTSVDVLGYMGDKIKDLDTSRELEYLRKLRQSKPRIAINDEEQETESDILDSFLSSVMYSFEIKNIQVCWLVSPLNQPTVGQEDLVLSFQRIEFATRKKNSAKLTIEDFQLQMVPPGQDKSRRSPNSALLPEVIFNIAFVSTADARRLAFQAVGKSLDLRLTSAFIVPAAHLQDSISLSAKNVQRASEHWAPIVMPEKPVKAATGLADQEVETRRSLFGSRRLESLLIDADFAGAVVHLSGKRPIDDPSTSARSKPMLAGKYGQFSTDETGSSMVLCAPGLAWKTEYRDNGKEDPTLYGEIKIAPSRNILYPTIVPLIMDITSSIKEVVGDDVSESPISPTKPSEDADKDKDKSKSNNEDNILTADPSAVLGRVKLNLGLRICKQEFTLSCQPIGRVAATARFEDIYITMNTVHGAEHGNFFAISGTFTGFHMSVQHVYSRESTGSFQVESIVLSMMNSKHVSGTSGVSAILKVSPMEVAINAKQLQDFLLFREIWMPREVRSNAAPVSTVTAESIAQGHLVQRYQQVAATAAFPWTATISIASLDVLVDLGQSLGKSKFAITEFWVSSKKTSDWEQNLCLGFASIGADCTGRLSGFVALQDFKLRTSIEWPEREEALNETPRIQASISFSQFKLKAAFDYQAFLVADITKMEFLMYNVRQEKNASGDRLVANLDGEAVQVFGTTTSASQSVALWQAIQKLMQERKASYETSLRDIEKFMKRKSLSSQPIAAQPSASKPHADKSETKSPISLDTDVVVTLKALNLGIFPSTFSDHQVFKLEALNAQAKFAANMEEKRIHSSLGLTLGQLRIGLAGVRRAEAPKAVSEISVEDVVGSATGSRGGTILKVPKVEARMQTWQAPASRNIEYIFKSSFEGKVEVGWNYSRISYIRGMWANHSKALAQTWGRELPAMSAIKVTGVPERTEDGGGGSGGGSGSEEGGQQKITAEVNVPQSKYEYAALEPPVIETPQLRDMGEATPPLEWIGLHRERLPNLTHQIVIVALLELAGEVEDAYAKILGSS